MDQGTQRQPLERVCRLAGDRIPERHLLNGQPPLRADQARRWGRYADNSPLYRHLIEVVADDPELLTALNRIESSPRPNIFFAGVQYLMLRDGPGDLGAYYPGLTADPRPFDDIAEPFRNFVLAHLEELAEIGRTRLTQTNECRRCVALLPAIWATPTERFHLVDFGSSAGLNLNLDRYDYRWGGVAWGEGSSVSLETDLRAGIVEPRPIEILTRTGLDLHPVDPTNHDDRLWLEALIWPEHGRRRQRLRAALEIAADHPPRFVAGNALEELYPFVEALPGSDPVVVMNSFILNQFAPPERGRLAGIVEDLRAIRPVFRVSMEWLDVEADGATLAIDTGAGLQPIGTAHPHGEWLALHQ